MMKRDPSTGHFAFATNSGPRAEMETVKVSPEFEVVIPKKIREALELKPGEDL
jgi:hypothetical protein